MATNARFKIDIYGDTANFENSLKGINSAMSNLKGEASQLKRELKLDPTNVNTMKKLQANLAQQLEVTKQKASNLKQEMSNVDKSTPAGQKRWLTLQKQLSENSLKANALEGDIKEVGQAIQRGNWKADIDVSQAEGSINRVKKGFSALREIGIGALRQIGSSAVSALGNGLRGWVSDAMSTQKAMLSLQNTMEFKGIGGGFQKLSGQMSKLATDTNANTEDTLKLATTFVGLGDTADVAGKKTTNLVKANQAFGGTGENLKGVVQAYGQMSASGKVTAENINQLTDNNTALGSALKSTVMEMNPALKQYGSFAGASEKGAISVEMLDKAMEKLGKAGGGQVQTIGDAWDSFNETMSLALLPTLQALTPVITALIDKMAGWGEIAGDAIGGIVQYVQFLWEAISDSGALDMLSGGFKALGSTIGSIIDIIKNVLVSFGILPEKAITADGSIKAISESVLQLSGKFEAIMIDISKFVKGISESKGAMEAIKVTLVALAGAFVALKVINGIIKAYELYNKILKVGTIIQGAFNAVMSINPFVALGVAIGAIVAGLVYFFTQTETGKKVWANFVDFLKRAWDSVVSFFSGIGQWFSDIWNGAVDGAKSIWQGLVDWFSGIVTGIQNAWNGMIEFFTGLWTTITTGIQDAWNGVTEFFTGLWNGITLIVQTVFATISSIVTGAYNWFVTTFQPLISFYQSIFGLIGAIINLAFQVIVGVVKTAYNLVIGAWQGLVGWWTGIFNVVKSVVQTVFNAIVGFGQWAWTGIVNIWNAVAGFFSGVFNSAKNIVSSAFAIIGNFAQNAWNRIVSIWNAVVGFFSGIFNGAKNIVSSAFSAIGSFASSAWGRVSSAFSPVVGFFSGVFNGARNAVSGALGDLGGIASRAFNAVTGAFSGIVSFFSNIFGSVRDVVDNVLGGITGTIDKITSAVNGAADKVKGFFGGSMVAEMRTVNLGASGIMLNSASSGTTNTTNTFNIQAGQMNTTALARAIKREIDNGRA